ncbi:MAG: hypothetical protein QM781_01590 [Chitinophagaceae bacterium]
MHKLFIYTLTLLATQLAVAQNNPFPNAPDTASLFDRLPVNTSLRERDFALSPDGQEVYYTLQAPAGGLQTILCLRKQPNGTWSAPSVAPFSGQYADLEPCFSPDGQQLYFVSNRPVEGSKTKDFDIWRMSRTATGWSQPVNLGSPVNTAADEFYPSISRNGTLYFTAAYRRGLGKEDIYAARWNGSNYEEPQALDAAINSMGYEFNAFVSADEQYILFTAYGRADDMGGGDLYLSKKNRNGQWQPAQNLRLINSGKLDYCPSLSPDGQILFFTSERMALPVAGDAAHNLTELQKAYAQVLNGGGNIYWISFAALLKTLSPNGE